MLSTKSFVSCTVLAALAVLVVRASHAQERHKVTKHELAGALYCLHRRSDPSWIQEFSGGEYFRVRYIFGIVDPAADQPNKLHLVIYSKDSTTAWLYEFLVERGSRETLLTWVNSAQLRKEGTQWKVTETLGGTYGYRRVYELANRIAKEKEHRIAVPKQMPNKVSCKEP